MKGPFILSIDGNIGSGKSTLYADLQTYYKDNSEICFCPEPVDSWTKIVDNNNTPILNKFIQRYKKVCFSVSNDGLYISSSSIKEKSKRKQI